MTDLVPVLALMMLVANVILSFGFYGGFKGFMMDSVVVWVWFTV